LTVKGDEKSRTSGGSKGLLLLVVEGHNFVENSTGAATVSDPHIVRFGEDAPSPCAHLVSTRENRQRAGMGRAISVRCPPSIRARKPVIATTDRRVARHSFDDDSVDRISTFINIENDCD
jgi:hypothetical protein